MAARVQLVIEAKDATGGVIRGLTSQLGSFGGLVDALTEKNMSWGNVTQMATQMVIEGIKDSIKVTTEYAREVRDLSLASGQSAEQSSRMLQVLDDYQLTAEDAKTATRALTKEALAPTMETIISLSAQYKNLTSVEEKNAFVTKNLGRASQEWLNLLDQGPDKIAAMNDAVDGSLVLTSENIKAAEEYRLALDEWNDAVMKLKVSIGNQLLPVLTDLMNTDVDKAMQRGAEATGVAGLAVKEYTEQLGILTPTIYETARAGDDLNRSATQLEPTLEELEEAEKAAAAAAKLMTDENKNFVSTLESVSSAMTTYNQGLAEADAQLAAGEITAKEHDAAVAALGATYEQTTARIVASLLQMKYTADGTFDDTELTKYLLATEKLGLITEDQRQETMRLYKEVDKLDASFDDSGSQIYHVGERAKDAAMDFATMGEGAEALGDKINSTTTPAVAGLKSSINQLQDKVVNIDVIIRTHGGMPGNTGWQGGVATVGPNAGLHYGGGGQQQGGEVYAGVPTRVGEAGWESFMPAHDGRILGHAESLRALAMGGGGGAKIGPFYGNVTISMSEDGVNGIMGIR